MSDLPRHLLSAATLVLFALLATGSTDGGTGGGGSVGGSGGSDSRSHDKISAYTICQQFVEDRLKAPSTADYPWDATERTTYLGSTRYRVDAYVDAENSFGAKIRNDFECTVKYTGGGNWRLENLNME